MTSPTGAVAAAPPGGHTPRAGTRALPWLAAVALCLALAGQGFLDPPSTADLRLRNGTEFTFAVEVAGGGPGGWLPVAIVAPGDERTIIEVLDQGERWRFRFHGQGLVGGEVEVERSALAARGWRLEVPEAAAARLRAAGVPPSPAGR